MKAKWTKSADVVALAVALVAAVVVIAKGAGTGREASHRAVEAARGATAKIDSSLQRDIYSGTESAKVLEGLAGLSARIRGQWQPPGGNDALTSSEFYHPGVIEDIREGREVELRLLPPQRLSAAPEPGRIMVSWSPNDRNSALLAGYTIVRRTSVDQTEKVVAEVSADQTVWSDADVRAGIEYTYRVEARTAEPGLLQIGTKVSEKSEPASARGARDFEIVIVACDAAAKEARLLVRRLAGDVWHEKEFPTKVGEGVGATDAGTGVDYRTGCTVVDVQIEEAKANEVREELVFAADGTVVLENGKPKKKKVEVARNRRTNVLVITNENGDREEIRQPG